MQVKIIHFPLHPETPADGRSLEDLFHGRNIDIVGMNQKMQERMEAEGLTYGQRTRTYNSRLAQELAKWAESQGKADAFHSAVFHAYFARGENIGKAQVLLEVSESIGLDSAEAEAVIETRRYKTAVDDDWQRCAQFGITGVPTYLIGGRALVGAYPYADLENLVGTDG